MKTLKSKVVCEDIHIEDYDKRRHRVKTMEHEDLVVHRSFSSLLSHRNHCTVKWGPRKLVRMTEVMLNQNPMSSSEDNESKSYPELDKSALLVAQVNCRVCLKSDRWNTCQFLSDPGSFRTNQVGLPSGYKAHPLQP